MLISIQKPYSQPYAEKIITSSVRILPIENQPVAESRAPAVHTTIA